MGQKKILDAACGCGYGSGYLHDNGSEVVGVDIDSGAIDWAKTYFPGPVYVQGDVREKPWDGEFDLVVSFETIEHLAEPERALKHFRASAKRLVASVPNEDQMPFQAKRYARDTYPHLRHYRPDEFSSLLEGCGWTVTNRLSQESKKGGLKEGTGGIFLVYACE